MSDFKAKMHQIWFRLRLCPRPHWGSLQRSSHPLAGFNGPTSEGREGRGDIPWLNDCTVDWLIFGWRVKNYVRRQTNDGKCVKTFCVQLKPRASVMLSAKYVCHCNIFWFTHLVSILCGQSSHTVASRYTATVYNPGGLQVSRDN